MLRMSRPGEKVTLKTIQMQNKMKEIDPPSKSLLANVLDMDEDFKTLQAVTRDGDIFTKGTILRKILIIS